MQKQLLSYQKLSLTQLLTYFTQPFSQNSTHHNSLHAHPLVSLNTAPTIIPPPVPGMSNPSTVTQQRRFPSNAIRQRNSTVAALNPEAEFQKTTIDACRSTIVQQEADIKILTESLDVRTKKVLQLEGQVGMATNYLSSRDANTSSNSEAITTDQLDSLCSSLNLLLVKMSALPEVLPSKTQVVNVYNTSNIQKPEVSDKSSQTTPINNSHLLRHITEPSSSARVEKHLMMIPKMGLVLPRTSITLQQMILLLPKMSSSVSFATKPSNPVLSWSNT